MKENRLNGLDHLRAIAIVLVLMYHYRAFRHPDWLDEVGRYGWTGVDLFFVLSGFLISSQLFREIQTNHTIRLKLFFTKRFFRIIPPFALTLLLYFSFPFFREREALPALWKFLTFTQNYGLDVVNKGTFSHAWSLCIEEQFYLILPLLLLLFVKINLLNKLNYVLVALLFVSLLLRIFAWDYFINPSVGSDDFWKIWYMHVYYPTHTRLDALTIGVLIGFLYEYSPAFKTVVQSNGLLFFCSGVIALALSFWICYDQASEMATIFGFTLVGLAYGLLVISALSDAGFLNRTSLVWTRQLADLSFAIYLSHKAVIHIIQDAVGQRIFSENQLLVICLLGCLAVGVLYRYAIERPSAWVKRQLINQQ